MIKGTLMFQMTTTVIVLYIGKKLNFVSFPDLTKDVPKMVRHIQVLIKPLTFEMSAMLNCFR